jgi:hypothetical protein
MAIRRQKKRDWQACKWWAERGLALYGQQAAREEAVEDLIKRRNRAIAKLEAASMPEKKSGRSAPIPPSCPQPHPEVCRAPSAWMPNSKCSSARNATAA